MYPEQTNGASLLSQEELDLEILEDKKRKRSGLGIPLQPEGMTIDMDDNRQAVQTQKESYHGGENLPKNEEISAGPMGQAHRKP